MKHISVLKNEAIEGLDIKEDGIYVDMTLGYAGHASEILKRIKRGFLFAFDKDLDAINYSDNMLSKIGQNYKIFNTSFKNIKEKLEEKDVFKVDGILFDLGVSSVEIDEKERGFSYMQDAKLDMRMDKNSKKSAYDVVNFYSKEDLIRIFREYGEEKHALKIANEIVLKRSIKKIETTFELVDIISSCYPWREKRSSHPAKKVFQAIRIEVNDELEDLEIALKDALDMLKVGGRICVISFHSLEDRIVKKIFNKVCEVDKLIKGVPNIDDSLLPDYELVTKKPILPTFDEISFNSRSKSAKLRIIEKVK